VTQALGEVRVTKSGRPFRSLTLFKDLTREQDRLAAQARLHQLLERGRVKLILGDDITFQQLTEYYLHDAEESGRLGPEAYQRTVEHLNRFGNWPAKDDPYRMDLRPCRQILAEDVEAYVAALLKEGLSDSYISEGLLKTVKATYAWAARVRAGRYPGLPLLSDPIRHVRGPQVKRRAAREESPENVEKLILWATRRAQGMNGLKRRFARISTILLLCLRDTGARPKELCSATWSDWHREAEGWSTITLEVWKNAKKTGEVRTIALPPRCTRRIAWIERQKGRHPSHIFVHRRPRGAVRKGEGTPEAGAPWVLDPAKVGSTKSLQKWFHRLRAEAIAAGVPISRSFRLYWNRSMFSTAAQRRDVPTSLLAKALGTSEAMLRRSYTDLDKTDVLAVARLIHKPPAAE
jgi:integrase